MAPSAPLYVDICLVRILAPAARLLSDVGLRAISKPLNTQFALIWNPYPRKGVYGVGS